MLCQLELLTRLIFCSLGERWRSRNFALAMQRVRAAFGAELFDRKFVGLRFFVFRGRVVARFAGIARK
jgi:hypothetical protein